MIGIDDAHWADDGLLDLIEEVVFRLNDAPLMVVCTSRPELLERRPDFGRAARNVTQIELRPLTAEAAGELAAALLPAETRGARAAGRRGLGRQPVLRRGGRAGDRRRRAGRRPIIFRTPCRPRSPRASTCCRRARSGLSSTRRCSARTSSRTALAELSGRRPDDALRSLTEKALVQERLAIGPDRYRLSPPR